ncbi:MAG: DUF4837 family protein [Bacteroidaceae bacterium]|nr:DUF4837 family protein [Bacteroidaceae bacterium]
MKKIFLLALIAIILTGCNGVSKHSIGNPYEVLVVCDDDIWEAPAGRALLYALDTDIPGLPQSERSFRISRVTKSHFKGSTKAFRNIIFVDINENRYTQGSFKFTRDVFAKPQVYMGIHAPSMQEFEKFVSENEQVIVDFLTRIEMERQINVLEGAYNEKAFNIVKEMFGCELKVPIYLNGHMKGKDFVWLSDFNDPKAEIQSFMVYSYPYTSVDNFSKEHYIMMRDSVMKHNIRAKRMDQYIKTVDWSVDITAGSYRDRYVQVARGLWEMQNDIMGGPFVSHAVVDEVNNRVIVVEAFLYAPNRKKGSMMRKLEAALFTLRLPADKLIENSNRLEEFVIEGN